MLLANGVTLILIISIDYVYTQIAAELRVEVCRKHKKCGSCIAEEPHCAWCADKSFPNNKFRCDTEESLQSSGCVNIQNPKPVIQIDQDKALKDYGSADDPNSDAVQLKPQGISIRLRPNEPVTFSVDFYLANNYPVDLYYVMDLSYTMLKHKEKLKNLGSTIVSKMDNITQNFKIGFGSFVDKVTMPYVNILPRKLKNPCDGGTQCTGPYGFRHHLSLVTDAKRFETKVGSAQASGNLDSPEGGFDAIMQAATCHSLIGWREVARKLMIYSSDSGFHYAGSGKLGGIVKPNDMKCHLERSGSFLEYSLSTYLDYPSISQIRHVLDKNNIVLIFAVTESQVKQYELLKEFLKDSAVGQLKNDSSNVVDLIEEVYRKISSKVVLTHTNPEDISLSFKSRCKEGKDKDEKDTNTCTDLHIGDKVTFQGTLTAKSCTKSQKITISPGGGLQEKLVINVDVQCDCDCEQPNMVKTNDAFCTSGNGSLVCGTCQCNPGYAGRKCECKTGDAGARELEDSCKMPNSTNTDDLCEGRGQCVCGECFCYSRTGSSSEKYSGNYCECDDFSCDNYNGALCGGNGDCECGKCRCYEGFDGDACNCPTSNSTCMAKNGEICNGHGHCKCGVCQCNLNEDFRGPTCEDCPVGCLSRCEITRDCVQCHMFGSGKLADQDVCKKNCTNYKINKFNEAKMRENDVNYCRFPDDDDCIFFYTYGYDRDNKNVYVINAQVTKECPKEVNILAIVLGVIGGIVAIGLALLLIWKILTTIHDRREFAKFEKERERAKWDTGENPIYKQATSNFKNPTYRQSAN